MKRTLISMISTLVIATTFSIAQDTNKTDEELIAEFMQLVEREKQAEIEIYKAKEKTKEYEKLEKTVDELAKTLGVEN